MKSRPLQALLITGALVLTIVLALSPSQVNKIKSDEDKSPQKASTILDDNRVVNAAVSSLSKEEKEQWKFFEESYSKNKQDTAILDQMGRFWDRKMVSSAAAVWFEKKAEMLQTEHSYLDAAYRFFDAFKEENDTAVRSLYVQKAIADYEKVISINPENLDAKTDLGACYADGTSNPMKGIMLLREVVEKNPNHEMAQYNLGMLSVKSGQLDKAVERFNKVLSINPTRSEVYFFLGQIYLQKKDTTAALASLQSFTTSSPDKNAVQEVKKMINEIKHPGK